MDRYAIMVDAGYFLRQSIELVSRRTSTRRSELDITDPAGLIALLISQSKAALGLTSRELLRVYWYDGVMPSGLTQQQRAIVQLPDVSFRPGTVNSNGQQKGVDSLIITDLIELAGNRAVCDAAVITGDGDLAIGIELAQKKGVRVALLGVEDLSVGVVHHQSFEVTSRADRIARMGLADISPVMRHSKHSKSNPTAPAEELQAKPLPTDSAEKKHCEESVPAAQGVAKRVLDESMKAKISASVKSFAEAQPSLGGVIDPSTKRVSAVVDRALVHQVFMDLGVGKLTNDEKIHARECLRAELGM